MKVTEEKLEEMLVEAYEYSFRKAREAYRDISEDELTKKEEKAYMLGKYQGEHEALGSMLLPIIGGKRLYKLWENLVDECLEN